MTDPAKPYGVGRIRSNVSYADVERTAIAILKSERRPTVETIREALGGGSPDTIGDALRRFWRDLGFRIEGDPAALTRMPVEIAELADEMWQRALKLAGEAATTPPASVYTSCRSRTTSSSDHSSYVNARSTLRRGSANERSPTPATTCYPCRRLSPVSRPPIRHRSEELPISRRRSRSIDSSSAR
jgi:hypothetical protein